MGYVRLKYIGESKTTVEAVATPDGKTYKPVKNLSISPGDVFLCEAKKAEQYKYREYEAETYEDNEGTQSVIGCGRTTTENIQEWDKKGYYEKWFDFEKRRSALLHYLCECESMYLFGEYGKTFLISFSTIFSWILANHHEYMPREQVQGLDFRDILESLKADKYIRYYHKENSSFHKIVLLEKFFELPEIRKAKKANELKKYNEYQAMFDGTPRSIDTDEGFEPFPSKENPQIQLTDSIITLGKVSIDLTDKRAVEKLKATYEKFEHNSEEIQKGGADAPNETIKGNFYLALRVLLSALDKSVGKRDEEGVCKFRVEDMKDVYEDYGSSLFKSYVSNPLFNIDNIGKRKSSVNALLRWAKVGANKDECIQLVHLIKTGSPGGEKGWYVIKKMKKFSRDGQKVDNDGNKTRGYGKRKK